MQTTGLSRYPLFTLALTFLLLLLGGSNSGCGGGGSSQVEPPTYEGRFVVANGTRSASFQLCGETATDPAWLITGDTARIYRFIDETAPYSPGHNGVRTLFVEVSGDLSPVGHYGPDGAYERELHLTETYTILDVDNGADGCFSLRSARLARLQRKGR
jgi:hypothetical protein